MKGLVCEFIGMPEKGLYLCVSEANSFGIMITSVDGEVFTTSPHSLKIVKHAKIPQIFEDWRVQMGFEVWNQD